MPTLRLSHYPSVAAEVDQWGIDPHSDAGFMTLLPANPVAGVWIKPPGAQWFEPAQERKSFVVNSGDMLRRCDDKKPARHPPITYRNYLIPFMQRSYVSVRARPGPDA